MDFEIESNNMKIISKTLNNNNNKNNKSNNNNNYNNNKDESTNRMKSPRDIKMVFDNRIKRKNVLALNEKVAAIREYQKRPIYKRIGRMFHCSPDQIKRIVQHKDAILTAWEQRTRKRDAKTLEMKVVRVSMLGKAVYEWIRRMMYYKDILITDGLIQKMALQFKSAMGLQHFFPHQDWCDKFRTIYKIVETDSKLLNIGYTTGHSVQIKDIIKDVLSECSPDDVDLVEEDQVKQLESVENKADHRLRTLNSGSNVVDVNSKTKILSNGHCMTTCSTLTPLSSLQKMQRLVALPIHNTALTGGPQKVLVATPITTNQRAGSTAPMTMTIIPLATLGQPTNLITPNNTACSTAPNNKSKPVEAFCVPSPIVDIKKEIKEEPKNDSDDDVDNNCNIQEILEIKKEYICDTNVDDDDPELEIDNKNNTNSKSIIQKSNECALLTSTPKTAMLNQASIEDVDSSNDSLEDVALAQLKHHIKEKTCNTSLKEKWKTLSCTTATASQIADSSHESSINAASSLSTTICINSQCHTTKRSVDGLRFTETVPITTAIKTCAQARAYLKLLEDFALERENFRLIGLITRADEVLRELVRKENGGTASDNDIEDIDID